MLEKNGIQQTNYHESRKQLACIYATESKFIINNNGNYGIHQHHPNFFGYPKIVCHYYSITIFQLFVYCYSFFPHRFFIPSQHLFFISSLSFFYPYIWVYFPWILNFFFWGLILQVIFKETINLNSVMMVRWFLQTSQWFGEEKSMSKRSFSDVFICISLVWHSFTFLFHFYFLYYIDPFQFIENVCLRRKKCLSMVCFYSPLKTRRV